MQQLACYQSKGGRNEVDAGTKVSGSMHGRKHAMGGQQASRVAPAGPKKRVKKQGSQGGKFDLFLSWMIRTRGQRRRF